MKKNLRLLISLMFLVLTFSVSPKTWGMENPYDIVEKVYAHNVTYSHAHHNYYKDEITLSSQPCSPQKAWKQNSLIYNKKSEEFKPETVLKKVIPGQDGRKNISNTTTWPYSIHTQLSMTLNGDTYGGSGSMVGPHHLLTCGHCVYDFDKGIFFEDISAYPALNGEIAPFGKVKVTKAYMFKGWRDQGDQRFDMALLLLDQPIGEYVGWGGLLSAVDTELSQEEVHITGYPGDKGFKQMWSMSHKIKTIKPEQFDYEIDTCGGQSGSAIWINQGGLPMILGVHTLGSNSINSGVRLSIQKFIDFKRMISETYILKSNHIGPIPVPPIAQGYEAIYQRFLNGKLIYRPNEGSDVGKIELPISALQNPLEGKFDLSQCGDAGKYLSISTGYRKWKKVENANKAEIWIAPRFLIEKELNTTAAYLQKIYGKWNAKAPVGIFWTMGTWDNLSYLDSLTTENMDELSNDNLYEKWRLRTWLIIRVFTAPVQDVQTHVSPQYSRQQKFHVHFGD